MGFKNTPTTYGSVAKTLHWLIFLLLSFQVTIGLLLNKLQEKAPATLEIYNLHKATGMLVLGLVIFRLAWRWNNITPRLPDSLSAPEKKLSRLIQGALYGLMFLIPLSGWTLSSAAGYPVDFYFGLIRFPALVAKDKALADLAVEVHAYLGFLLIGLVFIHAAAAIKHHFVAKNDILLSMVPRRSPPDA